MYDMPKGFSMTNRLISLVTLGVAATAFCTYSRPQADEPQDGHSSADDSCHIQTWNWNPKNPQGPGRWPGLCIDSSKPQSPIKLSSLGANLPPVLIAYNTAPFDAVLTNDGYKVLVDVKRHGGSIQIEGTDFVLEEFHIHTPSEHTMKGHESAVEMHLVHYDSAKNVAVLGILFNVADSGNPVLHQMITQVPEKCEGKPSPVSLRVKLSDLLPNGNGTGKYYAYQGSLTTPQCAPVKYWIVADTPAKVLGSDVQRLQHIVSLFPNNANAGNYPHNNRPLQTVPVTVGYREGKELVH
jgi:carbonic anhydrase